MNNDNNNFNFHISGLPANDEIEIPDTKTGISFKRGSISAEDLRKFGAEDIEKLKSELPPELNNIMKAMGLSPDAMINQALSMMGNLDDSQLQGMIEGLTGMSMMNGCSGNCSSCSEEDEKKNADDLFPTGNPKYLSPDEFGSIACQSRENLYDEFIAVYGTDSTKYLDDNTGIRNFILNDITAQLNFDNVKNMRFINSTNNFILFYMEPKDPTEYGYYAAVVKRPDNSFACYIPTYCNTFDIYIYEEDGNIEVFQFNEEDNPYAFEKPATDITGFTFLAANLIEFAVSFALAPVKHVLLSPNEFGTIKATRASITSDSSFFPIGKITSNGSTSATLLLKDAELPLDFESYNIFMKFPSVIDEHSLRFLSGIMFNVDFNNCELLKNVELKYTQDGKLYFDIDHLGEI